MSETGFFSKLSDDVILNILYNLEDEPGNWARIACVSTRFSSLIRTVCCKTKCSRAIPDVVSDLLSSGASVAGPPGGWASLYKLAVCCPGLVHSGVLLENSDFRIEAKSGPMKFTKRISYCRLNLKKLLLRERAEMPEARSAQPEFTVCKRRKICRSFRSHLASGVWNLSREQGNKLLAGRFKGGLLVHLRLAGLHSRRGEA
ncbi:UNVERIFIED_CONTAM: Phytochrome A-associated F-box protein [Sesamum latifolium]|uniref:Phytochrome A-associated F-box protein n=1 Tax=Sesamum latifolium TaxID=2727402 RepID=A0AAW2XUY4_9LAMI